VEQHQVCRFDVPCEQGLPVQIQLGIELGFCRRAIGWNRRLVLGKTNLLATYCQDQNDQI
jgi:hypothetical protein